MNINTARRDHFAENAVKRLRRKLLPVLIASCFGPALANPLGPQVVQGQAGFSQNSNVLSVTNTPGAIINWQSFSIGAGEVTRFIQQNASSSVLNRVVGQDPSAILGTLQSNGRVFLINPNGILFGAGAQIDVNGLVASTLNITNDDFLNGKMRFDAVGTAGKLRNEGAITTPDGGQVYLIAPDVENSGVITSPKGDVLLAAGHSVQLVDSANPDLHVVVSAPDSEALNLGRIITQGGTASIYGDLIRQRGIVSADSAVIGENGKIVFKASSDTLLERGSSTTATGAGSGGDIHLLGKRVGLTGDARVDASGQLGGGTVLVGGDVHGKNEAVMNAEYTYAGKDTQISADAVQSGDGGKVVLWADKATRARGTVTARGGAESGNGGFVETSGKEYLEYRGTTDLQAANGRTGTLLLDPSNIVIKGGTGDGYGMGDTTGFGDNVPGSIFAGDSGPSYVYQSEIEAQSVTADIVLDASEGITTDGTFSGGAVTLASGRNLALRTRNSTISADGSTGIDLTTSTHGADLEFRTQGTGTISIQGGYGASPSGVSVTVGKLRTDAGSISLSSSGMLNVNGMITTDSGNVHLSSNYGANLAPGGQIWANGGNIDLSVNGAGGMISTASGSHINAGDSGIMLAADSIDLQGTVHTAAGMVHLRPASTTTAIELGGNVMDTTDTLALSNDELNRISSPVLKIGSGSSAGNMAVMQTLDLMPSGTTEKLILDAGMGNLSIGQQIHVPGTLSLFSNATISQFAGAAISATSLKAVGNSVLLDLADNPVGVVAGSASGGDFRYRTLNKLTLSMVDGTNGIIGSTSGQVALQSLHAEGINQMAGSAIIAPGGLALKSAGPVFLEPAYNSVATLAAELNAATTPFTLRNANDLDIGTVGGIAGITTNNGNVRLITGAGATLTVSQPIQAGTAEVDLIADNLALNNTITADMAAIRPSTNTRDMTIGGACFSTPCLSVTDLYQVNATTVGLGDEDHAGSIHVAGITNTGGTAATDRNASTVRIGLMTTGGITQSGGINVDQLGIDAVGNVNLSLANSVTDLAAETDGGNFSFRNSGSLTVKTIDGADYGDDYLLDGISTFDGDVVLNVDTGDINVAATIDAGTGNATLNAGGNINVAAPVLTGPTGSLALTTGGDILLSSLLDAGTNGSILLASGGSIGGTGSVAGQMLEATASNGIQLTTAVDGLNAENTGASSDITITNTQPLTLYNVRQTGTGSTGNITISNVGALEVATAHAVSAGRGEISLTAHSPLTVNGSVTTSAATPGEGNISLWAHNSDAATTDILTINGAVTTNAGDIVLKAGADIIGADKAVSASGQVTSTSFLNPVFPLPGTSPTTVQQADKQASDTIQTTIAAVDTTADSTTSPTSSTSSTAPTGEKLASSTSETEGQAPEEEGDDTQEDQNDAAGTDDDGAKENEPAQKLYCN